MFVPNIEDFPKFDLIKLLTTCFGKPSDSVRLCILIDLPNIELIKNLKFADSDDYSVQKHGVDKFYTPLRGASGKEFNVSQVDLYAFKTTFGSNLDPEDDAMDINGNHLSLDKDIYPNYDIILATTDYSLTAPLTAKAKEYGFRGATLHGLNDIILNSGLSVDYNEISKQAEAFRKVLTNADSFEISFEALNEEFKLELICERQDAQKSHGLCPDGKPDVANLPAGEVYFVPDGAEGSFPFRYSDGTLAEMTVEGGKIISAKFLSGDEKLVNARNEQLKDDPATGIIGELGFGTCHVATGRSDHLGGNLTPELFNSKMNASHDDILYAPPKTPEINISKVKMHKDGASFDIFANYEPTPWLLDQLSTAYPADKFTASV